MGDFLLSWGYDVDNTKKWMREQFGGLENLLKGAGLHGYPTTSLGLACLCLLTAHGTAPLLWARYTLNSSHMLTRLIVSTKALHN